jgi:hypothetical protein
MKFFLDSANLGEIREAAELGLIDGVTTNPSLISKEGGVDFKEHIAAVCEIVAGDVSAVSSTPSARTALTTEPHSPRGTLRRARRREPPRREYRPQDARDVEARLFGGRQTVRHPRRRGGRLRRGADLARGRIPGPRAPALPGLPSTLQTHAVRVARLRSVGCVPLLYRASRLGCRDAARDTRFGTFQHRLVTIKYHFT